MTFRKNEFFSDIYPLENQASSHISSEEKIKVMKKKIEVIEKNNEANWGKYRKGYKMESKSKTEGIGSSFRRKNEWFEREKTVQSNYPPLRRCFRRSSEDYISGRDRSL